MLDNSESPSQGVRVGLSVLVVLSLVFPGCIGGNHPPASELEAPTWEVGQEWHYKGSNGQWRNWTVVATEEHRGYATYKVDINLSSPDNFGREVYTRWYDQDTRGAVGIQKGVNKSQGDVLWGWSDSPTPPTFPFDEETNPHVRNLTLYVGGERKEFHVVEVVQVLGWTKIRVGGQMEDVVKMRRLSPETNVSEQFWYAPSVENWARYTADVESVTFNLTSWERPK